MQLPGEFSPFIEKSVFLLSGRGGGVTSPYTLCGLTTKKNTLFLCVSSLRLAVYINSTVYGVNPLSPQDCCYLC